MVMRRYSINLLRNTIKNKGSYLGAVMVIAMGLLVFVAMTDVLSQFTLYPAGLLRCLRFCRCFCRGGRDPEGKLEELERIEGIDVAFGRLGKDVRAVIEGENNIIALGISWLMIKTTV